MAPGRERCAITPATRVADLLESWPKIEELLIAQAPPSAGSRKQDFRSFVREESPGRFETFVSRA